MSQQEGFKEMERIFKDIDKDFPVIPKNEIRIVFNLLNVVQLVFNMVGCKLGIAV